MLDLDSSDVEEIATALADQTHFDHVAGAVLASRIGQVLRRFTVGGFIP